MPAVAASGAEIVAVVDADVWVPGLAVAVDHVADGAPWAIPHHLVRRLNERATEAVLAGAEPGDIRDDQLAQRPYPGIEAGGAVVLRRDVALDVPLDPRFRGWGGEDHSWGYALCTLAGRPWRSTRPLYHLAHPPQPRLSRQVGSHESELLRRRYRAAIGQPEAMRQIVEEARTCLAT